MQRALDQLNQQSGYLLDWNRVGILLRNGHTYSYQEIFTRIGIIGATILGGSLFRNFFKDSLGANSAMLIGGGLAFTGSHLIAMQSTIANRRKIQSNIEEFCGNIQTLCQEKDISPVLKEHIEKKITEISKHYVSGEKSVQTLSNRKKLMKQLYDSLLEIADWKNEQDIISKVDNVIINTPSAHHSF